MAARQAAKPASRKGATTRKRAAPAKHPAPRVPGWLWGLGGLVAGFFLAQYVQDSAPAPLAKVFSRPTPDQAAPTSDAARREAGGEAGASDEPRMPTFEFYTLLPESEVIAPGGEPRGDAQAPARDPIAEQIASQQAKEAAQRQPTEIAGDQRYMLQAASFREPADARRLASRLSDFGLAASISEVQTGDGATWHRVQAGPYGDARELNRAQDLMITQGIEPLTIRLQD